MFDADKTTMSGLPYGEKNHDNISAFLSSSGTLQTDKIPISISRVSMLTRDKNTHYTAELMKRQFSLYTTDTFTPQNGSTCVALNP